MDDFGRNYDWDYQYGYRGGSGFGGRGGWGTSREMTNRYDVDYGTWRNRDRGWTGWNRNRDWGNQFGGNQFGGNQFGDDWRGQERGYKSRWETDFGDPFGDREQQTPFRMTNREHQYGRGFPTGHHRPYGGGGNWRGEGGHWRSEGGRPSGWGYGRGYDEGWR